MMRTWTSLGKRNRSKPNISFSNWVKLPSQEEVAKVGDKAPGVLKRAKEGEDFSQLAKKFSEDPGTKENGDLGYFSAGQMVKPLRVLHLRSKGEISDLVRTPFDITSSRLRTSKRREPNP
jgi:hypothetical protein